ncbi:MAG: hypothetical protein ACT4TC_25070, partial [Myxococcaceae bacterium]
MNFQEWSTLRAAAVRPLGPDDLRRITPSIRDFVHAVATQRRALAVIAESSAQVEAAAANPSIIKGHLERLCAAASATSVSAIAVCTDPTRGGSYEALAHASSLFDGPLLANDLIVSRHQLYAARLAGADAVLLTAAVAAAGELKAQIEIAGSMHVAAPVEVATDTELSAALQAGARVVLIPDALLSKVPRNVVAIVRGVAVAPYQGKADALWVPVAPAD